MKDRRKYIAGGVVVLLITAVIGRNILVNNMQTQKVVATVQYAAPLTIAAAPVYVADAMGFWNDEGLKVNVTYFDSGRKALDALISNNAEVMSVSETPPLRAYLTGSKIKIITTVTDHKEAKMTVRTDRISSPQDVKGKKIGTVAGTNSDYYMYRWLEANHIKVSDVQIVPLDAAALSQAFVQGNIDAMFAWEPYNYNAVSKIPTLAISWPTDLYSGRHTVVMNSDYIKNNPTVPVDLIKGFIKAEAYIKSSPEQAKLIVEKRTGMSADALNKLWDEYTYTVQIDDGLQSIINDEATWIKSNGANSTANVKQLVDPSYLLKVDTSRVGGTFKP